MTVPLMILAALSIVGGWFALPTLWGEEVRLKSSWSPSSAVSFPETVAVKFAHHSLLDRISPHGGFRRHRRVSASGWRTIFYLKHPQLHYKVAASWPRFTSF